jgi:uncharacterized membrane protein YbaN (DUF454 family)
MNQQQAETFASAVDLPRKPWRLFLAALGVVCVGLALVGVFVPGLPTTVFLIAAAYLFARSCPFLEERLIRRAPFRPYLRYLDGEPMPRRAKATAIALMWVAVTTSLAVLWLGERLEPWVGAAVVGAAIAGTVAISRIGRRRAFR